MGCDLALVAYKSEDNLVSIHAPAWGATLICSAASPTYPGFNPRTRMGCDQTACLLYAITIGVSIHAPAWGATNRFDTGQSLDVFQSTHPHGVRQKVVLRRPRTPQVSIHAPAWGATLSFFLLEVSYKFQSTHPHGVRRSCADSCQSRRRSFNPRTRMGCDRVSNVLRRVNRGFNPRTRMGCDPRKPFAVPPLTVSIHAPAWGATNGLDTVKERVLFQSTHPHGVRHFIRDRGIQSRSVSIHAPAWGATRTDHDASRRTLFQSTHPHGVRRGLQRVPGRRGCFNPRTRMGCDEICRRRNHDDTEFQSTHPHGVRPPETFCKTAANCFNPRTRMGCDTTTRRTD